MILTVTLILFSQAQAADMAIAAPILEQSPLPNSIDVPVNASLVLRRFPPPSEVRLVDAEGNTTNLVLETVVQGIVVARVPEQAPNSEVHLLVE